MHICNFGSLEHFATSDLVTLKMGRCVKRGSDALCQKLSLGISTL